MPASSISKPLTKRAVHKAVAASALVMLSGCTVQLAETEPDVTISASAPEVTVEPDTESQAQPQPTESSTPKPCAQEQEAALTSTITNQIEAFGAEDFELAYSYASPFFQAGVSLESFVQIIAGGYGPLIGSSDLEFSNCFINSSGELGLIELRFVEDGQDLYALVYYLISTDEGWRVQGASNLEVVGSGA